MLVTVAPWFAWMLWRFRSPIQMSGIVEPIVRRSRFLAARAGESGVASAVIWYHTRNFIAALRTALSIPLVYRSGQFSSLFVYGPVALLVVTSVYVLWPIRDSLRRAILRPSNVRAMVALCGAWVVAFVSAHAIGRWGFYRFYYAASTTPAVYVLIGVLVLVLARAASGWPRRLALSVTYGALAILLTYTTVTFDQNALPWQKTMLEGARWVGAHTPEDTVVGAWNAGITSFFSGRTTINLDGKINHEAAVAKISGDQTAYVQEQGIQIIADLEPAERCLLAGQVWGPIDIDGRLLKRIVVPEVPEMGYSVYDITDEGQSGQSEHPDADRN